MANEKYHNMQYLVVQFEHEDAAREKQKNLRAGFKECEALAANTPVGSRSPRSQRAKVD